MSHFNLVAPGHSIVKNHHQKTSIYGLTRPKHRVANLALYLMRVLGQLVETAHNPFNVNCV